MFLTGHLTLFSGSSYSQCQVRGQLTCPFLAGNILKVRPVHASGQCSDLVRHSEVTSCGCAISVCDNDDVKEPITNSWVILILEFLLVTVDWDIALI